MAMPRESAFMPTIKCSSCGRQVEISMMGDHICGGAGAGEPSPPPFPSDKFQTFVGQPPPEKYGRMPPRVDTGAANKGYMPQGQLTPVSSSTGSGSVSPRTPNGRSAGGRSDDYFAPKIANDEPMSSQGRRIGGGYGGLSDTEGYDAEFYPSSPKKQSSNLLQRMNTIAPGPFETSRRAGARNAFPREDRANDSTRGGFGADRPGTSASNNSFGSSNSNGGGVAPPRLPKKNGYGGFGPPGTNSDFEPEPFGANNRSETFPRPSDPVDAPLRTPSAPGPRPDRFRRPSNTGNGRRPSFGQGPDTSRTAPPQRGLVRPINDSALPVNLADEFGIGNPYHTPSDSLSSVSSSYSSQPSQPSSRTSPARSRKPSDTTGLTDLMLDLQDTMMVQSKDLPPTPKQPPPFDKGMGSLRTRDRRAPPPADLRLDPVVQGLPPRARSPLASPSLQPSRTPRTERYGMVGGRGLNEMSPPRERRRDPAIQSSRGKCKSCNEVITGKSISSADGRLSGRYHKACFVCTTCSEPFSSAEFYVLNDQPYCELHYHKLNGSLCNSCGRGIEGQYLEDEAMAKYHVGCFRCGDCGMSLSNGYYEVDGKSYCERDAWRRVQQPPLMINNDGLSRIEANIAATMPLPARDRDRDFASSPSSTPPRSRTPGPQAPAGLPGRAVSMRRPSTSSSNRPPQPFGLPRGEKLAPGMLPPPRPRMNKRMTRLGMM